MCKQAGERLVSLLLTLALVLVLSTGALAADPAAMTDIQGHWAQADITFCMEQGLYNGISETSFAPEASMTRGMFVTVLGRMAGVDPSAYADSYLPYLYSDVSAGAYYAPYVNWATRYGIVNGFGGGVFGPDTPINREQMATIMVRYASIFNSELVGQGGLVADYFTDADTVSEFARSSVESMRITGILNGMSNGDGTYRFAPKELTTRAQCAAVFHRISQALYPYTDRVLVDPAALTIAPASAALRIGDFTNLDAVISPEDASNQTITWVSDNPQVATVDGGTVTALASGTATISAYTWNGLRADCTITVSAPTPQPVIAETYEEKCMRIFGRVVKDPRAEYSSNPDYLTTVTVKVWDFTDSSHTEKYTKELNIKVHKNVADLVEAIFAEIYNGAEQFPIKSAGGYYYSPGDSEHTIGLAIDLNASSNYYCDPQGNALVGKHWDPENDPYSIPLEGDVVSAFAKYGFTRGIYWRSGYKDYMHFSYFGT